MMHLNGRELQVMTVYFSLLTANEVIVIQILITNSTTVTTKGFFQLPLYTPCLPSISPNCPVPHQRIPFHLTQRISLTYLPPHAPDQEFKNPLFHPTATGSGLQTREYVPMFPSWAKIAFRCSLVRHVPSSGLR